MMIAPAIIRVHRPAWWPRPSRLCTASPKMKPAKVKALAQTTAPAMFSSVKRQVGTLETPSAIGLAILRPKMKRKARIIAGTGYCASR